MIKDTSDPKRVFEYLGILLGILAWIFPDIHILMKIFISLFLVGAMLFISSKSDSLPNDLSFVFLLILLLFPVLVSMLEFWIAHILADKSNNFSSTYLQDGFVFGILFGLPITLFSYVVALVKDGYSLSRLLIWSFLYYGILEFLFLVISLFSSSVIFLSPLGFYYIENAVYSNISSAICLFEVAGVITQCLLFVLLGKGYAWMGRVNSRIDTQHP